MTFAERHAQVDDDTLVELKRRCQLWASCPSVDGGALEPDAQIVPLVTLKLAVDEIESWRQMAKEWEQVAARIAAAKARGSA